MQESRQVVPGQQEEGYEVKVYAATSAHRVHHIFADLKDAEAYEGADEVIEWDVLDHPVERRPWYEIIWSPKIEDREQIPGFRMANPHEACWQRDYTESDTGYVSLHWASRGHEVVLCVQGWELDRVRKVYAEQRAQYLDENSL